MIKKAIIKKDDRFGFFSVDFYKGKQLVGTIEYLDKNIYYVEDAVENWETGILKEETVLQYSK